ncbi:unnamed protein product [Adineta steineri]|uniref:F-box domain-containing protein n=1 Tax=Adineta steineri TaxID=433720 RepID=A0A814XHW9_9BILA|nr:unnamed protein product [Adineta steineri]CAF3594928.1 unnamed protein product [Adineta steineri]
MGTETRLENLPNEIFLEILDYLHALDIFSAFGSLNKRISSIFQSTPLRIIISQTHCRNQVDFLSSYLTFHAHQVISIKINDTIRDDTSIISLLFNRHDFINLQFCKFIRIDQSTKLNNVIQRIKNFDKLVSFKIANLNDITMNENDKYELARTIDPIATPSINEDDLPVLTHVISFELKLFVAWNIASIRSYISKYLFPVDLLDGYAWQEMLELYVPF